jgi:putative ATP-grasp target RiPP
MQAATLDRFASDPITSESAQFPLSRGSIASALGESPSPAGVRPWGLRRMTEIPFEGTPSPAGTYDPIQQFRVDATGRPLLEMGPPTAPKTGSMDGSEGDPSEDYHND